MGSNPCMLALQRHPQAPRTTRAATERPAPTAVAAHTAQARHLEVSPSHNLPLQLKWLAQQAAQPLSCIQKTRARTSNPCAAVSVAFSGTSCATARQSIVSTAAALGITRQCARTWAPRLQGVKRRLVTPPGRARPHTNLTALAPAPVVPAMVALAVQAALAPQVVGLAASMAACAAGQAGRTATEAALQAVAAAA